MLHEDYFIDTSFNNHKIIKSNSFKEWIQTNINQLDIINNLYDQIKNFILSDLSENQILKLKQYMRNSNIEFTKEENTLSNDYLSKYKYENNKYIFYIDTNIHNISKLPIIITSSSSIDKAAYEDGDGDLSKKCIYLYLINNKFDLNTIKHFLEYEYYIVHELTHFLDDINSNGKAFINNDKYNYIDKHHEFHAFLQMILSWLRNYINTFNGGLDFYQINKNRITPEFIQNLIDSKIKKIMSSKDINDINDYKLYMLQQYYNKMSNSNKRKVCSKIAELLQYNIKESIVYMKDLQTISENLPL